MATGSSPAKRSASAKTTTGKSVAVVSDATVSSARAFASGRRLTKKWQDLVVPAAGSAALMASTGTVPTDLILTAASPAHGLVAVTAVAGTAQYMRASEHARGARERRKIERTFRKLGFMEKPSTLYPQGRPPTMLKPEPTRAGVRLKVQIPEGYALQDLAKVAPALERNLGQITLAPAAPPERLLSRVSTTARRVTPGVKERDPLEDALEYGWFELNIRRREALAGAQAPWAHLKEMRADGFTGRSVWDGWHVAMDEDGEPVNLTLTQKNLLTGGEPGAGKSGGLHVICAGVALDPTAKLYVIDPSGGVELGQWEDVAEEIAEDAEQAVRLLAGLFQEMEERLAVMKMTREERRERGLPARNVARGEETIWIVIDELLALTTHANKDIRVACTSMLMKIVGQGRKVGFHLVASTLRPTGDVIPTSLRDLIQFKQAYRCTTAEASQAILGGRWAQMGYGGHMINGKVIGVNYLLAQGEPLPRRTRGVYLSEDELDEIAAMGVRLRGRQVRRVVRPPVRERIEVPAQPVGVVSRVAVEVDAEPAVVAVTSPKAAVVDGDAARRAHNARQMQGRRSRRRPPPAGRVKAVPGALNTSGSEK